MLVQQAPKTWQASQWIWMRTSWTDAQQRSSLSQNCSSRPSNLGSVPTSVPFTFNSKPFDISVPAIWTMLYAIEADQKCYLGVREGRIMVKTSLWSTMPSLSFQGLYFSFTDFSQWNTSTSHAHCCGLTSAQARYALPAG